VKQEGYTRIVLAAENPQIQALMDKGSQMGYLWKQGFFSEVDPQ